MKPEIENFQSGFSGMPGVSQNHDGSPKRRLQPILLLDEPLGYLGSSRSTIKYRTVRCTHGGVGLQFAEAPRQFRNVPFRKATTEK